MPAAAHWLTEYLNDTVSLLVSVLLLVAYHLYLRMKLRLNPHYTIQAVNHAARSAWVASIMKSEARSIVGVQTLRNSTMAATFFASTAVLLVMGTLTLSTQSDRLNVSWHQLNVLGSPHPGLWIAKVLFLLSDFLIAFFSFAMSVRLYNHVGYLLNVPADIRPPSITPESVAVHLNRAGNSYSVGMRTYYFAVPLVFWLFGPHFMVTATVVLIAALYRVDRVPRHVRVPRVFS